MPDVRVTAEGDIVALMETWPLQLDLAVGGEVFLVRLHPETRVTEDGLPEEPGRLQVGCRARVEGSRRGERTIRADRIDVLGRS